MSTVTTIDPPAVKKRGRPKKVAADIATPPQPTGAKMASTKAVASKEKVAKEKKAPARTAKTVAAKKDASKPVAPPRPASTAKSTPPSAATSPATKEKATPSREAAVPKPSAAKQPTPAAPAASTILDKVRATGTLKLRAQTTTTPTPTTKPTTSSKPNLPIQSSKPAAPTPSSIKPTHHPSTKTTTIPLPRAPSTKQHLNPSTTHRAPPPLFPLHQHGAQGRPVRQQRIIEPMVDGRLPAKYKPAARRITAIMVGLPIVLVLGWELFGRWQGQRVQKKWEGEIPSIV